MTASHKIRIGLNQINCITGDIQSNCQRILTDTQLAHERHHCDIAVFPELTLCGYPPEDLLLRPAFHKTISKSLNEIIHSAKDIKIIIGLPQKEGNELFNSALLIDQDKRVYSYHKQILPNYSVFDEKRYFSPGREIIIYEINGIPAALSICEDIWQPDVCRQAADAGAQLMININASPFHSGKQQLRKQILRQRVQETGMDIVYLNMVGGQDELVFDGGSMAINKQGDIVFEAHQFEEGLYVIDYTPDTPPRFTVPADYTHRELSENESIYQALVLGVRDYVHKNGFKGALIGLSGGIDSALTLCLAADALGKENVEAVLMPSRYTSSMSMEDSLTMVKLLDVKSHTISIEPPFNAFNESLKEVFTGLPTDTTEENIQSRCRGILLMAISNKTGKLVLTTGNKSEMAVGYATLYGDMAGGFAPLKDISKTLVYKLSCWRNEKSPVIPQRIIERPPTAELRENQLDQDSLPPYDILDPILEQYIEYDHSPEEIIKAGFDAETVKKVVRIVDRNEYKRRQAAPGVRITQRAFGRDRRYPITSGYRE